MFVYLTAVILRSAAKISILASMKKH